MKKIVLRKIPTGSLVTRYVLYAVILGAFFTIAALLATVIFDPAHPMNPYVGFVIFACIAAAIIIIIIIPGLIFPAIVKCYRMHRKKYILTEQEMLCYEGEKLTRRIPKDEFRLFGTFTVGRFPYLFFCTASDEEITKLADLHWEKRILAFSKEEIEKFEKTSAGIWQMKVTMYLQFAAEEHEGKVITVEWPNQKVMNEICGFWGLLPFLAGAEANKFSEHYSGKRSF